MDYRSPKEASNNLAVPSISVINSDEESKNRAEIDSIEKAVILNESQMSS